MPQEDNRRKGACPWTALQARLLSSSLSEPELLVSACPMDGSQVRGYIASDCLGMDTAATSALADDFETFINPGAANACSPSVQKSMLEMASVPDSQAMLLPAIRMTGHAVHRLHTLRGEHCSPLHADPPQVSRVQAGISNRGAQASGNFEPPTVTPCAHSLFSLLCVSLPCARLHMVCAHTNPSCC